MATSLNPYRILPLPHSAGAKPRQLAAHWRIPTLAIPWNSARHSARSSLYALFTGPRAPKQFLGGKYFRDCWVERRIPVRAVALAAFLHVIFILLPYPQLPAARRLASPQANVELTWSAPAQDLPLLDLPAEKPEPSPPSRPEEPLPPKGADAYHPRQTIFTGSLHPSHPRQMLINSAAPPRPPKILPLLPNIVQWAQSSQPARPRLLLNREDLAKLRPRQQAMRPVDEVPLPQVPNAEKQVADLNLAQSSAIAKPAMPLNASAAPRLAPRATRGDAGPVPDLQPSAQNSSASQTFIALSATPAPPFPQLPLVNGNLSARLAISPEGHKPGVPGGSPSNTAPAASGLLDASGAHSGGMGAAHEGHAASSVRISGGNPSSTSPVSGLGGMPPASIAGAAPNASPRSLPDKPAARLFSSDAPRKIPNIASLPPGAKPENILGPKKIYTLQVNMPNLSSATGSWVLSFTELNEDASHSSRAMPVPDAELTGPVPLRKVDPKYPPALIQERVEGEVVLYAVIRKDGSVDSIQLVSGLEDQLDLNAMQALARWKFRPGERAGSPIELEAIVHVPFRIAHSRF